MSAPVGPWPSDGAHAEWAMTVLLVDPDRRARRLAAAALRHGGYDVKTAGTARQALSLVRRQAVDAVVVDPAAAPGTAMVEDLRRDSAVPIIVVSPLADERQKVALLDAGADDYLTKPFGIEELLARVRAALRRSRRPGPPPPVATADFTIDVGTRRLFRTDGSEVRLTATEWRLAEILVRRAGHVVGHAELLQQVWGPEAAGKDHYLRVHMAHIRHKVEPRPATPRYFITYPGLGLLFTPTGAAPPARALTAPRNGRAAGAPRGTARPTGRR
jgi:two-component system KDP operon response regulator KdpE